MNKTTTRNESSPTLLAPANILQRKCACGNHTIAGGECDECGKEHRSLRRAAQTSEPETRGFDGVPSIVHGVLRSAGQPLDRATRDFFEPRFGRDFSRVRVHTDSKAAESAQAVNAMAYTVGQDVVFGAGQYAPTATSGRKLLAHELTHAVQQSSTGQLSSTVSTIGDPSNSAEQEAENAADAISSDQSASAFLHGPLLIARAPCTAAAVCSGGPVVGSAEEADVTGTAQEVGPRARRKRMTPARAFSTGHGGPALQLEKFLEKEAPGRLANLQGIFVDQDIAAFFEATTMSCSEWIANSLPAGSPTPPGMAGATKLCTFVHGALNQQALAFNTTTDATIGGKPRSRWRAETLESLIHETEHPHFEAGTSARAAPAGVTSATCKRPDILVELSELAAMLSEFPTAFNAAKAETTPTGPLHQSLDAWFDCKVQSCGENIKAALEQMGCRCSCAEVDAFVIDSFNFESATWSVSEKDALHRELKKAKWALRWPLSPSTP